MAALVGGHINESFRLQCAQGDWLLQWLNPAVFPRWRAVQQNVERVLAHLQQVDPGYGWPALWHVQGRSWIVHEGAPWRALQWLPGRRTLLQPPSLVVAHAGGRGYARFISALRTLPVARLQPILVGFHDLDLRLAQLRQAAAGAPSVRLQPARALLAGVLELGAELRQAMPAVLNVIVHGDTKFENLLFTPSGDSALPIDYDTVMAGTPGWDLGDMLRSIATPGDEDAPEPAAGLDEASLLACADGFAAGVADWMDADARAAMAPAPACIACVLAARFLTDHLHGDRYFRVSRGGQNLDRARRQLALARLLRPFSGPLAARLRDPCS